MLIYIVIMVFCYIDESGTPSIPGNTSHYVLAGLSIPIRYWKLCEKKISKIKEKYNLFEAEIHTGWIVRKYIEQDKIKDFDVLSYTQRRSEVEKYRKRELLKLQKTGNNKHYKQTRKNYRFTEAYIHLTYIERQQLVEDIANLIGSWSFVRIFAESIDKIHFDPARMAKSVDEQAFEQVVSRFEHYLQIITKSTGSVLYGALIHDNNDTVSKKHTLLMKKFHNSGTLWTSIKNIIETPFFVNSELTSMVQIADLVSFALRRYFENGEDDLLKRIQNRFDRKDGKIVGVRHFSDASCKCMFCV